MSDQTPRSFRLKALLILLVASLVSVLPALQGSLLSYDDQNLLLGPEGALSRSFGSFFTATYYYAYLPFYGLSYWIDGQLGADSSAMASSFDRSRSSIRPTVVTPRCSPARASI